MTDLTFLDGRYTFLESPRWQEAEQALYFCDIPHGAVYRLAAGSDQPELVLKIADWIHGFALSPDGDLLINAARRRAVLRYRPGFKDAGDFELVADLFPYCHGFLNEMIVHPDGYIYVSAIDFLLTHGEEFLSEVVRSPILLIRPDGSVSVATRATNGPNGMVVSPDGKTLYVADTFDSCIYAFAIAADGGLGEPTTFAKWEDEAPDGMCMDAEGAFWTGTKHRLIRFREGGDIISSFDLGPDHVIACMLGGRERRTLYALTVRMGGLLDMAGEPPTARRGYVDVGAPGVGKPSHYLTA